MADELPWIYNCLGTDVALNSQFISTVLLHLMTYDDDLF